MTSIDDLFKGLPSKRKFDPLRDPNEVYKSAKLAPNGRSTRHAHVEADDDDPGKGEDDADADADADMEAGPSRPPADDQDEGESYGPAGPEEPGDDEDGRFFGGGISTSEAQVLDFVDAADDAAEEKIDLPWLRRTALNFEKHINKNAELRARFESQPDKFIASEADLDADIRALSILGEHPELYTEFARLRCVASLVGLLAHENTDIAITAVEIISELTDEDVTATDVQWDVLVEALLEADLLGLLVSNFERLDETDEADRSGVYYALSVLENLCSRTTTAEAIAEQDKLIKWLLERAQREEKEVSQNKQYAAEILAILVQSSAGNRRRLAQLDAVDALLQLAAAYRKRDPEKGGDEEEYMENLFEALTCIVDEPEGKTSFIAAEGVELCLIMLKEGKMSKSAALRLLNHSTGGPAGAEVCQKLVEAGGLKTIFTAFMKKPDRTATEHLVDIFSTMLRRLPAESPERIRTLAKFMEKDYEKTEKLLKLRQSYASGVAAVDEQIADEAKAMDKDDREEMADMWFSRKLDAGLFALQTIDVILAWLVAEDDGARKTIKAALTARDEDFGVIKASIQERLEGVDAESEDGRDTREMLTTLLTFLQ